MVVEADLDGVDVVPDVQVRRKNASGVEAVHRARPGVEAVVIVFDHRRPVRSECPFETDAGRPAPPVRAASHIAGDAEAAAGVVDPGEIGYGIFVVRKGSAALAVDQDPVPGIADATGDGRDLVGTAPRTARTRRSR